MPQRKPPSTDPTWDAAKCLRLLRAISSRLAPLQRLAAEERSRGLTDCFSGSDGEPLWLSSLDAVRRGTKKTYARKGRRRGTQRNEGDAAPAATEEGVPTPFRTGTAPAEEVLPPAVWGGGVGKGKGKLASTKRDELEGGVLLGLKEVLKKTRGSTIPEEGTGVGVVSLRDACLRKVPACIALEIEERKRANPDDHTDVMNEIYNELETFGFLSHDGYPALEVVVRAHYLEMVVDLMHQKTISSRASRQDFVTAMMQDPGTTRGEKLAMGCELFSFQNDGLQRLENSYGSDNSMPKMPVSVVKHLLTQEYGGCITPVEDWTLHEIRRIGRYGDSGELDVIHMALEAACLGQMGNNRVYTSQSPTLSTGAISWRSNWQRSIGIMGIMTLIGSQAEPSDWRYITARRLRSTVAGLTLAVMRHYHGYVDGFSRRIPKGRAALVLKLLMTSLMLQLLVEPFPEQHAQVCTHTLIKHLRSWLVEICGDPETSLRVTSQLLIEFCRGAGCKDPVATREWVREVGKQLLSGSKSLDGDFSGMLRQIALSFTRRYAQEYPSLEVKVIVQDLELAIDQSGGLRDLLHDTGYRARAHDFPKQEMEWDEGLQEWLFVLPSASTNDAENEVMPKLPLGIAVIQPEALTPVRKKKYMTIASPDELQSGEFSIAEDPTTRSDVSDESPSRSSILDHSNDLFDLPETTVDDLDLTDITTPDDDSDELAMSARKRPAPVFDPEEPHNQRAEKRVRLEEPSFSDDELI